MLCGFHSCLCGLLQSSMVLTRSSTLPGWSWGSPPWIMSLGSDMVLIVPVRHRKGSAAWMPHPALWQGAPPPPYSAPAHSSTGSAIPLPSSPQVPGGNGELVVMWMPSPSAAIPSAFLPSAPSRLSSKNPMGDWGLLPSQESLGTLKQEK